MMTPEAPQPSKLRSTFKPEPQVLRSTFAPKEAEALQAEEPSHQDGELIHFEVDSFQIGQEFVQRDSGDIWRIFGFSTMQAAGDRGIRLERVSLDGRRATLVLDAADLANKLNTPGSAWHL